MNVPKVTTHRNRSHLDAIRNLRCLVCGVTPCDPAHVKTRGAGGGDEYFNLMPLCRVDHVKQHQMGIVTFARKNWGVYEWLLLNGWEIIDGKLRRA